MTLPPHVLHDMHLPSSYTLSNCRSTSGFLAIVLLQHLSSDLASASSQHNRSLRRDYREVLDILLIEQENADEIETKPFLNQVDHALHQILEIEHRRGHPRNLVGRFEL